MNRSRNLTATDVDQIVGILDCWSGKLTWDSLVDKVEERLHVRYTRQALDKHEEVKAAFGVRKKALARAQDRAERPPSDSPELDAAQQSIDRLEGENDRLKAENQRLLEQFARWAYNAHTRGLAEGFLDQPLPPVDRDRTERSKLQLVGQSPVQ
jgi:hypothetical protein